MILGNWLEKTRSRKMFKEKVPPLGATQVAARECWLYHLMLPLTYFILKQVWEIFSMQIVSLFKSFPFMISFQKPNFASLHFWWHTTPKFDSCPSVGWWYLTSNVAYGMQTILSGFLLLYCIIDGTLSISLLKLPSSYFSMYQKKVSGCIFKRSPTKIYNF